MRFRFDDPDDLNKASSICNELMWRLIIVDRARRKYERTGDKKLLRRAEEIRKFFKQSNENSVYLIRAIVDEESIHEHTKQFFDWMEQQEKEKKSKRKRAGGASL